MELEKSSFRFALLLISMLWAVGAQALVIGNPIDYTTPNLVGTADPGTGSGSIADELIWANQILALSAGITTTILETTGSVDYRTHDTDEYAAILTATGAVKDETQSPMVIAGFDWVFGKYDGQNAGYVLYFLGGEASTIPLFSNDIWVNGQNEGYMLSHWTVFGETDCCVKMSEPGTLGLMMIGMMGVVASRIRRRRSAK